MKKRTSNTGKKSILNIMRNTGLTLMFNNKKGVNDVSILAIILSIFLLTAILITPINQAFGNNVDTFNTTVYEKGINEKAESINTLNAFTILTNVLKLGLFDVGNTLGLPFWLDIIFTLLGLLFVIIIARNIWIGGGA